MHEYDRLLEEVRTKMLDLRQTIQTTAIDFIPRMYQALRQEDKTLTPKEARQRIEKDCPYFWSKRTILYALPDEAKNTIKQLAGKQRKRNCAAMIAAATNNGNVLLEHTNGSQYHNNVNSNLKQKNLTFRNYENNQIIENKEEQIRELEEVIRNQQEFQFQNAHQIFSENTTFYIPKEKFQQLKDCIEKSNECCLLKFDQNKIVTDIESDSSTTQL